MTDETTEIPCPSCGSWQDECRCAALRELRQSLDTLGLHVEQARMRQQRIDYDTAMARRALREYGYTR